MKKARVGKIIISVLAIVGLLVFLTPYVLKLEQVRSRITYEITHRLDSDIDIKAISWQWFPLPRIVLTDALVSNKQLEAEVPNILLFPDWLGLFRGKPGISRVVLNNPTLHLKSLAPSAGKESWSLPSLSATLVIKKGSLVLDAEGVFPGWLQHTNSLNFSNVAAKIHIEPDRVDASLKCTPPYAKSLETKGHFIPSKNSYELWIDCQDFKPHKILLASLNKSPVKPLDSDVNIKAAITGTGLDDMRASVKGDFPCLKIESHDKKMLFSCGYTDLSFKKQGQQIHVSVNALELTDPGLTLSGVIERRQAALTDEALWHIDLKAKEVDLSGVREKVLALFGRHKVADLVCSIVLGGKARKATYYFEGPVSRFRKLEAMTITADVDEAPVHVPNVDLDLKKASGQIEIRDGILTGQNLSAGLGDSLGTNGSLALGLVGKDKVFKLDMDLDADLSKLPPLLHRLVHHQGFRNELAKFSNVRGKTSGRLILGDRLKNISVRVDVSSIDGTADYERITWPTKIKKGQLRVLPDEVNWSNIQGVVGPNSIHETEGSVRWKDAVFLDIRKLNASLDSGPLFAELKRHSVLQEVLSKILLSIDGPLEVTDAWLKGPVKKPLSWKYSITANTKGLDFHSPRLPGPSSIEQASAQADQENVRISSCKMRLSDQQMNLNGDLKHKKWQDWQGRLDLSGTAREGISQWVKAKDWIPALYFPRTPCTLNHLRVAWDQKKTAVKGEVISDIENKKAIKVKLDISSSPKEFSIKDLTITTPAEKASLSLNLLQTPRENLLLNWEGCLKGDTLDKILEKNKILSGHIKGSCNLSCFLEDPSSARLKGPIEASELNWHWGVTKPIAVKYANLAGHNSWTDIEELFLKINGESVISEGRASFSKHNIDLDLDLKSDSLSWENLSQFLDTFKEKHPSPDLAPTSKSPNHQITKSPNSPLSLTGRINFELDRFKYTSIKKAAFPDKDQKVTDYVWQPLTGQVKFLPQGKTAVSISSGTVCGLNTTGTWRSGPAPDMANLFISTDHEKKVLFQDVLSCLGHDQNILDGPFVFNADIEGTPGNWQRGTIELQSSNGIIRRMTLLSKIFSVLNVIDLFSKNGLPDLLTEGFPFSQMDIKGIIKDNNLIIDHAIIKGKGLNLFGRGKIDLDDMDADMIVLVAPLKTIDTIVSKVPLLGKAIGGKDAAIVAFPVKIKGQIKDPEVTVLSPDTVGGAMIDLVKNTLMLPFHILSPIFP
ncbi:MAG: AsmA-like C-terminal domain-containing protein [Thermodesulfobacteriota bacterium]|nr:AsmA-like C-terminal domain-containing protein [Thermodesulfobacteriota bacterium]